MSGAGVPPPSGGAVRRWRRPAAAAATAAATVAGVVGVVADAAVVAAASAGRRPARSPQQGRRGRPDRPQQARSAQQQPGQQQRASSGRNSRGAAAATSGRVRQQQRRDDRDRGAAPRRSRSRAATIAQSTIARTRAATIAIARGRRRDDRAATQREQPARPFASTRTEPPPASTVERPALAAPPPSLAPLAHPSADIDAGWGADLDDRRDETPTPRAPPPSKPRSQRTPTPPPRRASRAIPTARTSSPATKRPSRPARIANVAGVKFRDAGTIYEFDAGDASYLRGERVVVESDRGPLVGTVAVGSRRLPVLDPLRRILRRATAVDESAKDKNAAKEREAYLFCKQRIRERNLPMKLVRVEYPLAGGKVLFYFASEERIDFRDLVKDLALAACTRASRCARSARATKPRWSAASARAAASCAARRGCRRSCRSRSRWPRIRASCSTRRRCRASAGASSAASSTSTISTRRCARACPRWASASTRPAGTGKVVELDVLRSRVRVWFDEGGSEIFPPDVLEVLHPAAAAGPRRQAAGGSARRRNLIRERPCASTSPRRSTTSPTCRTSGTPTPPSCATRSRATTACAADGRAFLTGTDEHGQKIARIAEAAKVTPRHYADKFADAYRATWKALEISNDDFIRTTDADHEATVQELWRAMEKNGTIYEGEYEGWYCVACERFYTEKELLPGQHLPRPQDQGRAASKRSRSTSSSRSSRSRSSSSTRSIPSSSSRRTAATR